MINHKYKFIFLHIPKCAGSSVGQTLMDICVNDPGDWHAYGCTGEHRDDENSSTGYQCVKFGPDIHYDKFDEQMYKDYFVFTFVRNPWSRIVSHFKFRDDIRADNTFEYFVKNFEELFEEWATKNWWGRASEHIHIPSQIDFLRGTHKYSQEIDRTPYIDFIGKVENSQEDFDKVLDLIGVEPSSEYDGMWMENQSEYKIDDYRTMYTPELREYIAMKYSEDISRFNYKFDIYN